MEDSGKFLVPPVQEIEYLKLKLVALSSLNCEAFVDDLVWSCHSKNVKIESGNCILVMELCEMLLVEGGDGDLIIWKM
ncbi:hypothetical protein RHMOL_Rhmol02G0102500 [Rhododendron molle]|uniref:Uncharacterized protein n=1 Tax=Rhododendron molle TaxID=49168 RepID=A0ACC0PQ54_RHOML|nr:hypothetical protein RHMOL_Rhmol02G0102500 [Rhododendron molle]